MQEHALQQLVSLALLPRRTLTISFLSSSTVVTEPADIIRIGGLLRATESAAQAVSYGLNAVQSFGLVGASALNFALWGVSLFPAWLVVREIGVTYFGRGEKEIREREAILYGTGKGDGTSSEGTAPGTPEEKERA